MKNKSNLYSKSENILKKIYLSYFVIVISIICMYISNTLNLNKIKLFLSKYYFLNKTSNIYFKFTNSPNETNNEQNNNKDSS